MEHLTGPRLTKTSSEHMLQIKAENLYETEVSAAQKPPGSSRLHSTKQVIPVLGTGKFGNGADICFAYLRGES